jgi:ribose 1,5-bisphosphokinase
MTLSTDNTRRGPGCFVLILGPSGAGKDTLMNAVRRDLSHRADIHFVTRVVTRPPDESEQSIAVSETEFSDRAARGAFCLIWEAHGLRYGIPVEVDRLLRSGETAVANVSRGIIADVRRRYARSAVVLVDAPEETRRRRLLERSREDAATIAERVDRRVQTGHDGEPDVRIINDGAVAASVEQLKKVILDCADHTT